LEDKASSLDLFFCRGKLKMLGQSLATGYKESMDTRRFNRIQGSTSFLPLEHTNVGLYVHKKRAVLIDSGYTEADAERIADLLESEVITLEAILNTHAHPDNCGGSYYLKKRLGCKVYISQAQRTFLENPSRSNYIAMVQAAAGKEKEALAEQALPPVVEEGSEATPAAEVALPEALLEEEVFFKRAVIQPKPCLADGVLNPNRPFVMSNGKAFTIVDLSGHVVGQYGIITPDNVFFIADALYTFDELCDKPIPYLESVEQFKKTLDVLLQTPYSDFVPTHGKPLAFSISDEVLFHQRQIEMIEQAISLHLQMAHTKEELTALLFATFGIEQTIPNFYMMSATIVSFLNYLKRQGRITIIHEDGKTRWFSKQK